MRREADEGHPKADCSFPSNEYHTGLSNMSIVKRRGSTGEFAPNEVRMFPKKVLGTPKTFNRHYFLKVFGSPEPFLQKGFRWGSEAATR
jgi:hypothetical protein